MVWTAPDGIDVPWWSCQRTTREAVRGTCYSHFHRYVEEPVSASRRGCGRTGGCSQAAEAGSGAGVLRQAVCAGDGWPGGVRRGALLGAAVGEAGARGEAHRAAAREGVRQAGQERRARRGGWLRGDEPADDAVRSDQGRGAAGGADAERGAPASAA